MFLVISSISTMNINIFSVWTIWSWFVWAIGKGRFSSRAVNCIWVVPWSFHNEIISVDACYLLGVWESYITHWKAKRSANYSCVAQGKVIVANLVPFSSIENFSSSPNSLESTIWEGHIFWGGQSVVSICSVIWWSWASDIDIFPVTAIADRSIRTLAKVIFISWAWNIVHQNWFLVSVRKILFSCIWQGSNTLPADSSESWIERSAKNISCSQIEIWIITNCPPVSSIIKLSSSFPGSLGDILIVVHTKSSSSITRNKRWILILKICLGRLKTWLISKNSLSIWAGNRCS